MTKVVLKNMDVVFIPSPHNEWYGLDDSGNLYFSENKSAGHGVFALFRDWSYFIDMEDEDGKD